MTERHREKMAAHISNPKSTKLKVAPVAWKMYLCIFIIGLTAVFIVGYGFYSGNRINTVDATLLQAAMKIKLEAATTNMVIEGLLGDGLVGDLEPVWQPLSSAFLNFQTIFRANKNPPQLLPFHPNLAEPALVGSIESTLSEFKQRGFERLTNKKNSFIDEEVDQKYRSTFNALMGLLGTLEDNLRQSMAKNLDHFRYSQKIMIGLCVLLIILAAIIFKRFENQRAMAFFFLKGVNDQLQKEIEQRISSENAVRASEERFRQLAENIMELFWLEDVREPGVIVYVSPTFDLWWNRTPEDVYRDKDLFWEIVHPEDRNRVITSYQGFIKGVEEFDAKFRIICQNKSLRWIHARGFPILDGEGRTFRVAGLAHDITEEKRHEARQEQLVKELMDFSYAVSHDFRAPLVNIKGFSQEIRAALELIKPAIDEAGEFLPAKSKKQAMAAMNEDMPESLDFIDASVVKMERLMHAILKLSRLGRRELDFEQLNVNAMLNDILKSFAYEINSRNIKVSLENLPETIADRVSMEQIFSNLLSNAIRCLKPGSVGEVKILGESRLDENAFHVYDNGCGIETSDQEKVFNMFERLGKSSDDGEGMGLAYVRALVRRHGGEVSCESECGVGSKFTFTISKKLGSAAIN